jgi:hypothetical protein
MKTEKYECLVAYPFGDVSPGDIQGLAWKPNGEFITPDGALKKAKDHVRDFAGAKPVCLVRHGGRNLWFVRWRECWDVSSGVAVAA